MTPIVVGIAGGTGSGKTTLSNQIIAHVGIEYIAYIQHDYYYSDLGDMPFAERIKRNYDHPNSLETTLLVEHLTMLRRGEAVDVPIYDFATHARCAETKQIDPLPLIIVEGILVLCEPTLRSLMDIRIFVDTDADIRFIRRLKRDIEERGRTMQSVIDQYMTTVRPMHTQFVEPSKCHADMIITEGSRNQTVIDMITSRAFSSDRNL